MSNFSRLLADARASVREITIVDAQAPHLNDNWTFLDVREPEESLQGVIPGSIVLPRGNLELHIESVVPDKSTPLLVYCAAGVRSVFAAATLNLLGYTNVASLAGGFDAWKANGGSWSMPKQLSPQQRQRYHRHLLLPQVGERGQQKLLESRVLVLGAGGLGSPAALYLAAAGVGTLGILDMDEVDVTNLQRQILHTTPRVGRRKVDSARESLLDLNPEIEIQTYDCRLDAANVDTVIADYDIVVDGTDNFATRYLLNDAAVRQDLPIVYGSIFQFEGQVTVFAPPDGPCYRCYIPSPPPAELAPSCAQAGVLGVLPGIIGTLQAMETIKLLLEIGDPLIGRILVYEALSESFATFTLPRDPNCPSCGNQEESTRHEPFVGGRRSWVGTTRAPTSRDPSTQPQW